MPCMITLCVQVLCESTLWCGTWDEPLEDFMVWVQACNCESELFQCRIILILILFGCVITCQSCTLTCMFDRWSGNRFCMHCQNATLSLQDVLVWQAWRAWSPFCSNCALSSVCSLDNYAACQYHLKLLYIEHLTASSFLVFLFYAACQCKCCTKFVSRYVSMCKCIMGLFTVRVATSAEARPGWGCSKCCCRMRKLR